MTLTATSNVVLDSGRGQPRATYVPDVVDDADMIATKKRTAVNGRLFVEQVFHCRRSTELFKDLHLKRRPAHELLYSFPLDITLCYHIMW